ncbi:MAG: alpha/beta fold hydrolase [Noviherbaspirillum sp.]
MDGASSSASSATGTPIRQGRENTMLYGANVHANGIRQHYLRFGGAGTPLLLVPGIVSPAALWQPVGQRLGKHFDVYVLDVRGRGLTESGSHLDYSVDACADDAIAIARELGLDQYILLGHSMGARIGARAARRAGPALQHLIMVDPPVSGPGRRPYPSSLPPLLALLDAARRGRADEALHRPGMPVWPEELVRLRAEWLHTCDERAVIDSHRGFHEEDFHADLARLTVKAGLITAGKGGVILPEDLAEIRQLVPAMSILTVEGAGHQIAIDDPEGFYRAVGELLDMEL